MPTIHTENGFRFFIPTNDHGPAHIHVSKGGRDAKLSLVPDIYLLGETKMKMKDLSEAFAIVERQQAAFLQAWKTLHPGK